MLKFKQINNRDKYGKLTWHGHGHCVEEGEGDDGGGDETEEFHLDWKFWGVLMLKRNWWSSWVTKG